MAYGYGNQQNNQWQVWDPYSAMDEFLSGPGANPVPREDGMGPQPDLMSQFGSALHTDYRTEAERGRIKGQQYDDALNFMWDEGIQGARDEQDRDIAEGRQFADYSANLQYGSAEDAAEAQRAAVDEYGSSLDDLYGDFQNEASDLEMRGDMMTADQDFFADMMREEQIARIEEDEERTTKDYETARELTMDSLKEDRATQDMVASKSRMHEAAVKKNLDMQLDEEINMIRSNSSLTPAQQQDAENQARAQHSTGVSQSIGRLENERIQMMAQVGNAVSRGLQIGSNTFKGIGDALNARSAQNNQAMNQVNSIAANLRSSVRSTAAGLYSTAGQMTAKGLEMLNQGRQTVMNAKMGIENNLNNNFATIARGWEKSQLQLTEMDMRGDQLINQGLGNIGEMIKNRPVPSQSASSYIMKMFEMYAGLQAVGIDPSAEGSAMGWASLAGTNPTDWKPFWEAPKSQYRARSQVGPSQHTIGGLMEQQGMDGNFYGNYGLMPGMSVPMMRDEEGNMVRAYRQRRPGFVTSHDEGYTPYRYA